MISMGEGCWLKELVLQPGTYEYLFVADGKWLPDPLSRETVPNPFGGRNSVFVVPK
jgi:5'-AMP-activated protein kinase regulatory beta subunit